ncbi:MAG: hypothetical protein ACREFQ_20890 [Stellaceae bacterium]
MVVWLGAKGLAKRNGVTARRGLKEAGSKGAADGQEPDLETLPPLPDGS